MFAERRSSLGKKSSLRFTRRIYNSMLVVLTAFGVTQGAYADLDRAAAWLESQQDVSDSSWHDSSQPRTFLQTAEAVLSYDTFDRRMMPIK